MKSLDKGCYNRLLIALPAKIGNETFNMFSIIREYVESLFIYDLLNEKDINIILKI